MNDGGNWLHMMFITNAEGMPMTTAKGDGDKTVVWCGEGQTSGVVRDLITGRGGDVLRPLLSYMKTMVYMDLNIMLAINMVN